MVVCCALCAMVIFHDQLVYFAVCRISSPVKSLNFHNFVQVERLRKENEWLKDEANRTKMESHEYLQVCYYKYLSNFVMYS